ncbi:response regulator [Dendrosporobacter sp. 1207_IL3150]|uniref:response regulator n=1 Tax=Dendrosporobacter sp. 1207_IL3150 TaxID=3084054 RepID=UPI002FDAFF69
MKILVIDDDEACRISIVNFLRKTGYSVLACSDGRAGLDILSQTQDVDLIFSDLQMPVLSGLELIERVRASEKWNKVTIILCSADTTEALQHKAIKLGAHSFLPKPIDIVELISILKVLEVSI